MKHAVLLLVAFTGCAPCDFPKEATPLPGVLSAADDCGYWTVSVGDHLVVGLPVETEAAVCAVEVDDGVSLNADPIFTNFAPDGPRWTVDAVGNSVTERGTVDIDCDDGSEWHALVQVLE